MQCFINLQPKDKAKCMGKETAALLDRLPGRLAGMFRGWAIQNGEYGKFASALDREFGDLHARPKVREFIAGVCSSPNSYGVERDHLSVKYVFSKIAGLVDSAELKKAIMDTIGPDLKRATDHVEGIPVGFPHAYRPPC